MSKQPLVKKPKFPVTKSKSRILFDKDFLKHGFKKTSQDGDHRSYQKKMGLFDFDIHSTSMSFSMRITMWKDRKDKKYDFSTRVIYNTLIFKKSDLNWLLSRCQIYIKAQIDDLKSQGHKS